MDRLEPHDCGDPVSRYITADGKELARNVLVGALLILKKGVQKRNTAVFFDREQGDIVEAFSAPRYKDLPGL